MTDSLDSAVEPEMSKENVAHLNEFASKKHPGLVGVEILTCTSEEVTGQLVVREEVIAGTGFLLGK